jgi:hypothetical protein
MEMPLNPFSSEFTCQKCGYLSEYLLTVCPACGHSNDPDAKPDASHITATGMYPAPVDPVETKRSNIKVLRALKIICGSFAICVFFLIVPFWIIPSAQGPDANGYYTLPRSRSQSGVSKMSEGALHGGALAILVISAALFGGYLYLRRKQSEKEDEFRAGGHEL